MVLVWCRTYSLGIYSEWKLSDLDEACSLLMKHTMEVNNSGFWFDNLDVCIAVSYQLHHGSAPKNILLNNCSVCVCVLWGRCQFGKKRKIFRYYLLIIKKGTKYTPFQILPLLNIQIYKSISLSYIYIYISSRGINIFRLLYFC